MQKVLTAGLLTAALLTGVTADENKTGKLKLEFEPLANVTIQAQKDMYSNGHGDNLDNWFGRLALGGTLKMGRSTLEAELRFYPVGFGHDFRGPGITQETEWTYYTRYEKVPGSDFGGNPPQYIAIRDSVATGVRDVFQDDLNEFLLERTQIQRALYTVDGKFLTFRVGRNFTYDTEGLVFGNYIDEAATNNVFLGKGVYANFLEIEKKIGITSTAIMLEATDVSLNKGNLRTTVDITPTEQINLQVGYKSNVFDYIYNDYADVVHTVSFNGALTFENNMKLFAETAIKDIYYKTDTYVPVLVGINVPFNGKFKYVQLEAEAMKTGSREKLTGVEKSPVLFGLTSAVEFNKYLLLSMGVNTLNDIRKPTLALELSGGIL